MHPDYFLHLAIHLNILKFKIISLNSMNNFIHNKYSIYNFIEFILEIVPINVDDCGLTTHYQYTIIFRYFPI